MAMVAVIYSQLLGRSPEAVLYAEHREQPMQRRLPDYVSLRILSPLPGTHPEATALGACSPLWRQLLLVGALEVSTVLPGGFRPAPWCIILLSFSTQGLPRRDT